MRPPHNADNTQRAFDGRHEHPQCASWFKPPDGLAGRGAGNDGHTWRQHRVDVFCVIVGGDDKGRRALDTCFDERGVRRGAIGNAHEPVIRSRPSHLLNSPAPRAHSDGACTHEASYALAEVGPSMPRSCPGSADIPR